MTDNVISSLNHRKTFFPRDLIFSTTTIISLMNSEFYDYS